MIFRLCAYAPSMPFSARSWLVLASALELLLAGAPARALEPEKGGHAEVRLEASEIPAGALKHTVLVNGIPCGVQGAWRTVTLLPQGEALLEPVGHVQVRLPGSIHSATRRIDAGRIRAWRSGVAELWLEADGTLFAISEGPVTLIRGGWESTLPQLSSPEN
jgi:hypothetical protein